MSADNIAALRSVYEEWGRGNWRPKFDLYAPDMVWGWSDEFPGLEGVHYDPAVRNERLRRWLSSWEHWCCEAEEYIPAGDYVVVICRYTGRGKGSGVDIDVHGAHLWKLRDGKAVRIEIFSSRSRALAAAGVTDRSE